MDRSDIEGITHSSEVDPLTVTKQLQREGRWTDQAEDNHNDMMKQYRKQGMSKQKAQLWTYQELGRLYPPEPINQAVKEVHSANSAESG